LHARFSPVKIVKKKSGGGDISSFLPVKMITCSRQEVLYINPPEYFLKNEYKNLFKKYQNIRLSI
jgi:hypothetical protein